MRPWSRLLLACAPVMVATWVAGGEAIADEPVAAADRPARWGLSANLGTGSLGGGFGSILEKPVSGELNLFRASGPWRFGAGVSFGSFKMSPPYESELEWGFQRTYLSATRMLRSQGSVRPYLQVRGGLARLHARSELFNMDPLPSDFVIGNSTTLPHNGFGVSLVPGVEWGLSRMVAVDLSASLGYGSVDEV